jgi:TM2 domain-containing membrane protein YozV
MMKVAKNNEVNIADMVALEQELHELKEANGISEKHGRISNAISRFFDRQEAKKEITLNKKKYLLLAIFTGWMGGHRFYARQYPVAILYLLLSWTGFGAAMTIVDLLIVIPKQCDENGMMIL